MLLASFATSTAAVIVGNNNRPISEPVLVVLEQPVVQEETLKEKAIRIAGEHGISSKTLLNLVTYESRWNPNADNGADRGIVQINRKFHPEITDAQAFNPEWALNWAASEIALGKISQWTVCNCYSFMKTQLGPLPRMANIVPNISEPTVGAIAIFNYSGEKHVALITVITDSANTKTLSVFEANYESCKIANRDVDINDKHLVGFHLLAQ